MTNHRSQLLNLLESLRRELASVTLDSQQASELARLIDAIEAQAPGRPAGDLPDDAPGQDSSSDPRSATKSYMDSASGIQQHLIDDLNREATALEIDHPDTVATVRTLINMLSNLGI